MVLRPTPRLQPAAGSLGRLAILQIGTCLGALVAGAGCVARYEPPKIEQPETAPAGSVLEAGPYLRATRLGRWVYERVELRDEKRIEAGRYVRQYRSERMLEGLLEARPPAPLAEYLHHEDSGGGPEPQPRRPLPIFRHETLIPFEITEPMPSIPAELTSQHPIISSTPLHYYNRRGHRAATGTLTRRAEIEGTQDVDCPAGRFADCLRVRVDLEIRFPWGPTIDWTTRLWLSKEVGEVRRVQEFTGWMLIFFFGSAHEYLLVEHESAGLAAVSTQPADLAPAWGRGLVTMDRGFPHPQISGLAVDFAATQPATAPAQ
ncbi:MAG: hypothetical protein AMXMBFR13_02780 [Phycisphaerae bacterium]